MSSVTSEEVRAMNCYICATQAVKREAIGSCRHCQAPLCEEHLPEWARETYDDALWCCSHAYALTYEEAAMRVATAWAQSSMAMTSDSMLMTSASSR
jgi:hypothetical protein